jgi:hypothetical protein
MSNDGTPWHSDDELASALERALEIPVDGIGETGQAYVTEAGSPATASNDFSELFAALTEPAEENITSSASVDVEASQAPAGLAIPEVFDSGAVVSGVAVSETAVAEVAPEQVFESLDDFKPRTNFIPVIEEPAVATQDAVPSASVPVTSAHVTQPVRWDRKRPSFDEIIFGTATIAESN